MLNKSFTRSHLFGFLLLVPFLLLLTFHSLLDLSDGLMVHTSSDRDARTFNLIMVAVFYMGVFAFVFHAFRYAPRSDIWLITKFVALIVYWGVVRLISP